MMDDIKALYQKATDYVTAHVINLVDECAYQEWDDATTTRVQKWIDRVAKLEDPQIPEVEAAPTATDTPDTYANDEVPVVEADPSAVPF